MSKIPKNELDERLYRFNAAMDKSCPDWEICAIAGGVNMYYLTGTIQDGLLIIERGRVAILWVRRSAERAAAESLFGEIRSMNSFRDVAAEYPNLPDTLYLDMNEATLAWYSLLTKYMPFKNVRPADRVMLGVRAVKSAFEIDLMRRAGQTVNRLLRHELPGMLRTGISEAELGGELFSLFINNGYHGISRFIMRNADTVLGHIGFGESPLYPSVFNGASGVRGICPAAPVLGSSEVKLREGDLVYIDVVFGIEGCNTDRTLVFSFGSNPDPVAAAAHMRCLEIEKFTASMLKPGAIPAEIYAAAYEFALSDADDTFRAGFMGAPGRGVKFIGHGVGLYVDEAPVIAAGFNDPIEEGMTIAIEPKVALPGIGMVGSENTYLVVSPAVLPEPESLTGERSEIIVV